LGNLELWQIALLAVAAFGAGFIDAVVGGGGLVQVPALFSVLPNAPAATLFGTNKLAGIWGTAWAAVRYARSVPMAWRPALAGAAAALVFSFVGAWGVTVLPSEFLRKLLPWVLGAVWIYTLLKHDLGSTHAPRHSARGQMLWAVVLGAVLGAYDGFFGPGTGSFLVFAFVRVLGYDFLRASASAKVINVACNLGALALFLPGGHVIWLVGLMMAACNLTGSQFGSRMAIAKGSGFVRWMFIIVVGALILRTTWDAYLR
jgi:uncharacterized membrane protein YfcA